MKSLLSFLLVLLIHLVLLVPFTYALSERAYQDYLYQFDLFRQKYSDFTIAKNEYEKFGSLTSQTTALTKTSDMLAQRDQLLRAYLLLLNEKLNEDRGLGDTQRSTYRTLINNEISFLDQHSTLVQSIGSLEDASNVSRELESHYAVLGASIRQTIVGVSLGQLAVLTRQFDQNLADTKALVTTSRSSLLPQKQATVDRWLLQIQNVRSLYQQKVDSISTKNFQLKGNSIDGLDDLFRELKRDLGQAKQYLIEGNRFMGELIETIRYQD
ncbi:hypothetical protein HY411_02560 [Candidatus Gottesmanbacteria bacterium]|nr:hypothetical protein [Candidatus Gottesmanbacteria bacterium]